MLASSALPGEESAPLRPLEWSHYVVDSAAELEEEASEHRGRAAAALPGAGTAASSTNSVVGYTHQGCCSPCAGRTTLFINLCGVMERIDEQAREQEPAVVRAARTRLPRHARSSFACSGARLLDCLMPPKKELLLPDPAPQASAGVDGNFHTQIIALGLCSCCRRCIATWAPHSMPPPASWACSPSAARWRRRCPLPWPVWQGTG